MTPSHRKPATRTKALATQVTPDHHARVHAAAQRRGITVSALLWEIIAPALAELPPAAPAVPRPRARREPLVRPAVAAPAETRDVTAIIMGDPPPERSALGRRHVR